MTPHTIRTVYADENHRLVVVWSDGAKRDLDLSQVDGAPKDSVQFRNPEVVDQGVRWPNDLQITTAALWDLGMTQSAATLRAWRKRHRLSQADAAEILGIGVRMLRHYEHAEHPIPNAILLALDGYDARLGMPVRPAPKRPDTPDHS